MGIEMLPNIRRFLILYMSPINWLSPKFSPESVAGFNAECDRAIGACMVPGDSF